MSCGGSSLTRRKFNIALAAGVVAVFDEAVVGSASAQSEDLKIGLLFTQKGTNAADGILQLNGALLAIEEANAKGGVAGHKITAIVLDDYSTTTGDYDPAQAAQGARQLAGDPGVVAVVGPKTSASAKAIAAILNQADLATIGPSGTLTDLTDPKLAKIYRPSSRITYFRTLTTDSYQAPGMANFLAEQVKVMSAFVLDDGTAFGIGVANAFRKQAALKGIHVLGSDRINPREADYRAVLTKVKSLGAQALYYTGNENAGVNLAKQSYEIIPDAIKAGTDSLFGGAFLKPTGFPAANGWYVTVAAPHVLNDPAVSAWVARFVTRFGVQPFDYSLTAYNAALVVLDAIGRVAESGKPIDRHSVRDAIQATNLTTLQGPIKFDDNGDLTNTVVSAFQVQHDPGFPDDDSLHQFKYIGVAPAT
jgi:branched-chain amino acid transport system substrate-binding protein